MVASGSLPWCGDLLAESNLVFLGTVVCDPAPGITNTTLLAFGSDLGPVERTIASTNYLLGSLDLTAVSGDERITIQPAGNADTNALYLGTLTGVTPATAASRLTSTIRLYYDDRANPVLEGQTIDLDGGGELTPFNRATRGTLLLIH